MLWGKSNVYAVHIPWQYNAEKQQALEELQRVKQEAKRKADESQEDHRREMASLRDEVTKAKGAYEVKLKVRTAPYMLRQEASWIR